MFEKGWRNRFTVLTVTWFLTITLSACTSDLDDAELIRYLESNRDKFERVVSLVQATEVLDEQTVYASDSKNITHENILEIQNLLTELDIHSLYVMRGVARIDFVRYDPSAGGLLSAPIKKGYAYFRDADINRGGSNQRSSLDEVFPSPHVPLYRPINEHWYLYMPQSPD